jgi:uncharacterized FAD-dependent dehydrogenase
MRNKYDVIIVGAGPAGIFAALELTQAADLNVLLLEKGKDLDSRRCPIIGRDLSCPPCHPCGLVSGWGGAGAFSDGKLTLSSQVGGQLDGYLGPERTADLIRHVDNVYLRFGASADVYGRGPAAERLAPRAEAAGLNLIPVPIRHMGTELSREVLGDMRRFLADRVESRTNMGAASIVTRNGAVSGVDTDDGQRIESDYVIMAPGREGADWLLKEADRMGLTLHANPVDIGVRVEVASAVLDELTSQLYEAKLEYTSPACVHRERSPWRRREATIPSLL